MSNILISILDVNISRDFSYAKIYVSMFNDHKALELENLVSILQNASKHIQYLLSQKIYFRVIPKLHFCYDNSYIHGIKITALINDALKNKSV